MVELIRNVYFGHRSDVRAFLEAFISMINFCIRKSLELGLTSYAKLRKAVYEEFKRRYNGWHSHYCRSSCRIATQILRNWRKRCRRGGPDGITP